MRQLLERLSLTINRWRVYLRVREELGTYSERELHDMGMTKADIGQIAREAAALSELTDRTALQQDLYERQAGRKVAYPYV
jgi:uncharacterized protein YjiS (DUF1127 family)